MLVTGFFDFGKRDRTAVIVGASVGVKENKLFDTLDAADGIFGVFPDLFARYKELSLIHI